MHKVCTRGEIMFSLVFTFKKVVENFEVNLNVPKGDLRFGAHIENTHGIKITYKVTYAKRLGWNSS